MENNNCKGCQVSQYCGTMVSSIKLCNQKTKNMLTKIDNGEYLKWEHSKWYLLFLIIWGIIGFLCIYIALNA
jgi:hypothetical protein